MRRALAVAGCVVGLSACGLPASSPPEHIDPGRLPAVLLQTPGATQQLPVAGTAVTVYFVRGDRLAVTDRQVQGRNAAAGAIRALLNGPSPTESTAGVLTEVPAGTRLLSLDLTGSVATVDLSAAFGTAGGSQQVLAVAQIVYTLTASHAIDAVSFALDGRPIEVPDGSGALSTAARTRDDYRAVAPPAG